MKSDYRVKAQGFVSDMSKLPFVNEYLSRARSEDEFASAHAHRVAILATNLAIELGMDAPSQVSLAGLLHEADERKLATEETRGFSVSSAKQQLVDLAHVYDELMFPHEGYGEQLSIEQLKENIAERFQGNKKYLDMLLERI